MFWKEKLPRLLSPPPNGRAVHFSTFFLKDIKLNELKKNNNKKKWSRSVFLVIILACAVCKCVRAPIERRNAELCKQFADFYVNFFFQIKMIRFFKKKIVWKFFNDIDALEINKKKSIPRRQQ